MHAYSSRKVTIKTLSQNAILHAHSTLRIAFVHTYCVRKKMPFCLVIINIYILVSILLWLHMCKCGKYISTKVNRQFMVQALQITHVVYHWEYTEFQIL